MEYLSRLAEDVRRGGSNLRRSWKKRIFFSEDGSQLESWVLGHDVVRKEMVSMVMSQYVVDKYGRLLVGDKMYLPLNMAAKMLGVSRYQLRTLIAKGSVRDVVRIMRTVLVSRGELELLKEERHRWSYAGGNRAKVKGDREVRWKRNEDSKARLTYGQCLRALLFAERYKDVLLELRSRLMVAWSPVLDKLSDAKIREQAFLDHLEDEYKVVRSSKTLRSLSVRKVMELMDNQLEVQECRHSFRMEDEEMGAPESNSGAVSMAKMLLGSGQWDPLRKRTHEWNARRGEDEEWFRRTSLPEGQQPSEGGHERGEEQAG